MTKEEFMRGVDESAAALVNIELLEAQHKADKLALDEVFSAEITPLKDNLKALNKQLAAYAKDNKKELFGDKQSTATEISDFGFRLGNVKVTPTTQVKDDGMVEFLRGLPNGRGMPYLTVSYTLDKSKIADAIIEGVEWIKNLFNRTQKERFFCERKKSDPKQS